MNDFIHRILDEHKDYHRDELRFLAKYKEYLRDEFDEDEDGKTYFDDYGYLSLAHTTLGANEEFSIQVSYNPFSLTLKIEVWGDLSVTKREEVDLNNAYRYLDFDECCAVATDLIEKYVGEDYEW